jgi:zinc transport system substrate-binding protein
MYLKLSKLFSFFILCAILNLPDKVFAEPIRVFVSILPQKYFVERIGGPWVIAEALVGQGQNPATYNPNPKQMVRLANAPAFFRIGVPFESVWSSRIISANKGMTIVDTHNGVTLIDMENMFEHGDLEEETLGHSHAGNHRKDPHIWTDPKIVKVVAKNIKEALIELIPNRKKIFESNYEKFVEDLNNLDLQIKETLRQVQQRKFLVFHPSWGYFAKAYGLSQIAVEVEGKEPGSRSLGKIMQLGKELGVKVVFVQKQFSKTAAQKIAGALGARVEAVDPVAEDYLENLLVVAKTFSEALN